MSTFAEERRAGTLELLLTMPVRDWQVIAGKLMAVSLFLFAAIGMTLFYVFVMSFLGDMDAGATFSSYLGLALLGMTCGSIGILASSLTRNQIIAFILGFGIIFVLFLLDKVTAFVPGRLAGILQYLGTDYHYRNMLRGVIDTRDLLYYFSVMAFSGILTAYSLSRRPE
jgi:ABC-2 type transport system permease protein